jgi:hypothetical protein
MVAFATPPREPNDWFRPPELVAGGPLAAPATVRRRARAPQRWVWPLLAMLLGVTTYGVVAQLPLALPVPVDSFARNRIESQAARLMREQLPAAPRLADVRRLMSASQLFCRSAIGDGTDSLLTCLGHAVRYQGAYSRMAFRVVSRGDSVTTVSACPALVIHRRVPAPATLERARPDLGSTDCWRDPANPADSDWAWTSLPDSVRFTLVPTPDAPRMRVESAPSADTITVVW